MSEEKTTKKTAKAETAKLEAIEMTAEQKEKFLQFMEKEEQAKIAKEDEERYKGTTVKVQLSFKHNINGKAFGPGTAEIPLELLGLLQSQETAKRQAELKMLTSNKRTFRILESGGSIEIPNSRVPKNF